MVTSQPKIILSSGRVIDIPNVEVLQFLRFCEGNKAMRQRKRLEGTTRREIRSTRKEKNVYYKIGYGDNDIRTYICILDNCGEAFCTQKSVRKHILKKLLGRGVSFPPIAQVENDERYEKSPPKPMILSPQNMISIGMSAFHPYYPKPIQHFLDSSNQISSSEKEQLMNNFLSYQQFVYSSWNRLTAPLVTHSYVNIVNDNRAMKRNFRITSYGTVVMDY